MHDAALTQTRRQNRLLIHRLAEIDRTAHGHPEAPTPLEAIAGIRALAPALHRHFAELREVCHEHAERMAPEHASLLARFGALSGERRLLSDAHALARGVRDHLCWVESEVLSLRAPSV